MFPTLRTFPTLRVLGAACGLLLSACGHTLQDVPGFDAAAWRQDTYACRNQRASLLPTLLQHRDLLYNARTSSVETLLGRPDENELSEQTEKIYVYYVQPGAQCQPRHPRSPAAQLRIRFSPTGTVSEVLYRPQ